MDSGAKTCKSDSCTALAKTVHLAEIPAQRCGNRRYAYARDANLRTAVIGAF